MKSLVIVICYLLVQQGHSNPFKRFYKDSNRLLKSEVGADVGEPLFLTPYLQEGKIEKAQQAALVRNSKFLDVVSYSGYFTVDERFNSNIWFWFFPSAGNATQDPVVLWLNGGPGVTSLNGLFDENGPFIINSDSSVSLREYSWHNNQSLIFIDNPVGVGFSFTNGGLARNETKVGEDMHSALSQFFQLFPDLQKNDFFISGESYAGKYLPAIGYTIMKNNPTADLKINLQGILIGDGWTDPVHQVNYGTYVYNTGLVSAEVAKQVDDYRDKIVKSIEAGNYLAALDYWNTQLGLIQDASDVNIYNYIDEGGDYSPWSQFLNAAEIRRALHVGGVQFGDKGAGNALNEDMFHSIVPWVEELLENYRVLVYTGQVDIIVGYPMVLEYLQTLNFTGAGAYHGSQRKIWYVDSEPAGYVRVGGNLVELLVRNAGHMVPTDQPKWAYDMLYRFTRNVPYA